MSKTAEELARLVDGEVVGDGSREIRAATSAAAAAPDTLTFAESGSALAAALASDAGAVVVGRDAEAETEKCLIRTENPRLAFARIAALLHPEPRPAPGVHPTAIVHASAEIDGSASVGPHCSVHEGARIGARTVVGDGGSIGRDARVGADCRLHPNVTIYPETVLGDRVRVHAGAVLGSDGFGYVDAPDGKVKFPQLGILVIEDDVEIGANTTIDRAALDRTVIGRGTVIDNLVQIAHNVEVGRATAISAQTGVAGTAKIGDRVILGGQCGVGDHTFLEDGVVLGAQGGVGTGKRVKGPGLYWGSPARPLREVLKSQAEVLRLGRLKERVRSLERRLAALEGASS